VVVHAILEPSIACLVGAGHSFQHDGSIVGQDEAVPDQQDAPLAEADAAVVGADQARTLRDEQMPARRAVEDVCRDLGSDLARQVRAEPGEQRRGDDAAGPDDEGARRRLEAVRRGRAPVGRPAQEGEPPVGAVGTDRHLARIR
jgi:hypothetical protein